MDIVIYYCKECDAYFADPEDMGCPCCGSLNVIPAEDTQLDEEDGSPI